MTLKNAATFAMAGTLMLTILLAMDFIQTVSGFASGIVAAGVALRSTVFLIAGLGLTVFLYYFNCSQPRK